jgi:AraC-like DNA-binding protein
MHGHGMKLSLRSYGERVVTHAHEFHQVAFPVAGELDHRIGPIAGTLSARRFGVIPRGEQHAFRASGRNCFLVLDTDWPVVGKGPAIRTLDATLAELVRYAARELASRTLPAALNFHLAALLAGKVQQSNADASPSDEPVEQALAIMTARYAERLTVAELAEAAGLGSSQFHAIFRRRTGKSPAEMLADLRLDSASIMLRETKLPIAEIALAVGFSDQSALTRCLRRRRATTPLALRRGGAAGA